MKKRILVMSLLITLMGLLLFSVITTDLSYKSLIQNSKDSLKIHMNAYDASITFDADGARALSQRLSGARVTLMTLDGEVVADSALEAPAGSRADRPEVADAVLEGEGFAVRKSSTVNENLLYYCKKFDDKLVRIALPTSSEWDIVLSTLPTLAWLIALDVVVCLIFTYLATSFILKPVEELTRKSRFSSAVGTKYSELEPIADILNRKNREIERQLTVIESEKNRIVAAEQSKNDFIANITHEMNTPLTSIKGFAELIDNGKLDQKQSSKAIKTILKQSERLSGLIACIINYNEIDNDALPSYPCSVTDIARETIEALAPSIAERGIELVTDIDDGVTVLSRHERLSEIFGNLIRNATKYNKPEGGSITVRVKGGDSPFLEISDTGIGIAEENLGKVFSRFFTVDKSHGGKNGGFGLGLAVVKKLCNRSGWKLSVESVLDEGTTFKIEF